MPRGAAPSGDRRKDKAKPKAKEDAVTADATPAAAANSANAVVAAVQPPPPPPLRHPLTVHPAPSHGHGRVWRKAASVAAISPRSESSLASAPATFPDSNGHSAAAAADASASMDFAATATVPATVTAQALHDLSSSAPFPLDLLSSAAAASTTAASAAASAHNIAGRSSPATSVSSSTSELEGQLSRHAATPTAVTSETPNPLVLSFDFDSAAARFAPDPQHLQLLAQHAQLESLHDETALALQHEREEKAALERTAQMRAEQLEQTRKLLEDAQAAERHAELQAQQQAHTNELLNSQLVAARTESEIAAGNYLAAIQDMQAHTQRTVELHQQSTARQSAQLGREAAMAFLAAAVAESAKRAPPPPPPPATVDLAEHERVLEELTELRRAHSELEHAHSALAHSRAHMQSQRILELEAGMDLLTTSSRVLQDELDALHPRAAQARQQLTEALEQLAAARDALKAEQLALAQTKAAHASEIAALQADLQKHAESYAALQSQKADLARELNATQSRLTKAASKAGELQALQHELDKARKAHDELQALYASTKDAYKESQAKASRSAATIEKMRQAKETLTAQLEKSEREKVDMQRKLDFAAGASSVNPMHRIPATDSESKSNGSSAASDSFVGNAASATASPSAAVAAVLVSSSLASPSALKAGPSDRRLRRELSEATARATALDRENRTLRDSLTRAEAATKLLRQRLNIKATRVSRAKSPDLGTPVSEASAFNTPPSTRAARKQQDQKDDDEAAQADTSSLVGLNQSSTQFVYASPSTAHPSPAATQLLTPSAASPSSPWSVSLNASLSGPAAVMALRSDFHELSAQHSALQEELDGVQQLYVDAMQERDAALSAREVLQRQLDEQQRLLDSQSSSIDDARDTTIHAVEHMRARTGEVEALQALHAKRIADFEHQLALLQSELSNAQLLVRASDAVLQKERREVNQMQLESQKEQIKRQRQQAELLLEAQQRLHEALHPPPTPLRKLIVFRQKDMRIAPEKLRELCAELVLQTRYVSRALREWAPYRTDCVTALNYLLNSLVSKHGHSASICWGSDLVSMGALPEWIHRSSHGAWAAREITASDQLMPGDLIFLAGKRGDAPVTRCAACMEEQKIKRGRDPTDRRVNHVAMVIAGTEVFHSSVQCQGGCIESLDSLYNRYTSFADADFMLSSTDSRDKPVLPTASAASVEAAAVDAEGSSASAPSESRGNKLEANAAASLAAAASLSHTASAVSGSTESLSLADLAATPTLPRMVDVSTSTITAVDASTSTDEPVATSAEAQKGQDLFAVLKPVPAEDSRSKAASLPAAAAAPISFKSAASSPDPLACIEREPSSQDMLSGPAAHADPAPDAAAMELHRLRASLADFKQQLVEHELAKEELEDRLHKLGAQAQQQVEQHREQIAYFEHTLANVRAELEKQSEQAEQAQKARAVDEQLKTELQAAVAETTQLRTTLQERVTRIEELQALLDVELERVAEIERSLDRERQLSTSASEAANRRTAELEVALEGQKQQLTTLNEAIEAQNAELAQSKAKLAQVQATTAEAALFAAAAATSAIEAAKAETAAAWIALAEADAAAAAAAAAAPLPPVSAASRSLSPNSAVDHGDAAASLVSFSPPLAPAPAPLDVSAAALDSSDADVIETLPVLSAEDFASEISLLTFGEESAPSVSNSPRSEAHVAQFTSVAASLPHSTAAGRSASISPSSPLPAPPIEDSHLLHDHTALAQIDESPLIARWSSSTERAALLALVETQARSLEKFIRQKEDHQDEINTMREQMDAALATAGATSVALRGDLESAQTQLARQRFELHNLQVALTAQEALTRREHESLELSQAALRKQAAEAQEAEAKLTADLATAVQRAEHAESEWAVAEERVAQLGSELKAAAVREEQAKSDLRSTTARAEQTESKCTALQVQLDLTASSLAAATADSATAAERVQSLEDEVKTLNTAMTRAHSDALESLEALERAEQNRIALQARLDAALQEQVSLQARLTELQQQLESAKLSSSESISSAAAAATVRIEALEDEVRSLNAAIARSHDDALEALQAQEGAQQATADLQNRYDSLHKQLDASNLELATAHSALAQTKSDAAAAAASAAESLTSLEEEVRTLNSAIARAHSDALEASEAREMTEKARADLQTHLTEVQLQLQAAQKDLNDTQRQQQLLAAELAEVQLEAEAAARVAADHARSLDEQIISLSTSLASAHKEALASLSADRQAEMTEVLAGATRRHQEELARLAHLHAAQLAIVHSENEVAMRSELARLRAHHDGELATLRAGANESELMDSMRKDIARLTDERGARQRERKVLQGKVQAGVKEAAAAKLREESLLADLAAAKATSAALLAQVGFVPPSLPASPRVEQNDVADEVASLRSQLAIAHSQMHAVTADLTAARSQASLDSSDIASTVKEHGELQSLYTQLGEECEALKLAEAQQAKEVERLTSELLTLRAELQEARKQAIATEDTLQQGIRREATLVETLGAVETQLKELETQLRAKDLRITELESTLAAATAVSADAFSLEDLTALQDDLIQLQQELQEADAHCEAKLAEQKQAHDAAYSALVSSDKRALLEAEDALVAARRECASLRQDLSKDRASLVEERLARANDQAAAPALVNLQRESARLAAHVAEQSGMERAALLEIIRVQKVELEQASGLKRALAESSGLALARMMEEGRDAVAEKEKIALALLSARADVQRLELYARGVEQQLRATVPRSPAVRPPPLAVPSSSPLSPHRSNGHTPSSFSRALHLNSPQTPSRAGPLSPLEGVVLSPSTPTRRLRVTSFGDADASSVSVDSAKAKKAAAVGIIAEEAEGTATTPRNTSLAATARE